MKAVILEAVDQPFVVENIELQDLGPREIRVEVGASGVCHTDLSLKRGQYGFQQPIVVGHEGAGTVVEVGRDVSLVRPGDRVIAVFSPACGTCYQCARGRTHLCERMFDHMPHPVAVRGGAPIAAMGGLGTMSEVMTLNEYQVVRVETDLPDEQLALIGCGVTTGAGASLYAAGVIPGSSVAVIGCGGVGMSAIQGARAAGASQIIAVDPVAAKRQAAAKFGATNAVNPLDEDALDQIRALTDGRGVEYAIEVAGRPEAMRFAYDATVRGGTTVFVGAMPPSLTLELPANDIHVSNKRLIGSVYGCAQVRRDIPALVRMAETGQLDLDLMISRRFGIDEVNTALEVMESGDVIRSVLVM